MLPICGGLSLHPKWYVPLTDSASDDEIQRLLYQLGPSIMLVKGVISVSKKRQRFWWKSQHVNSGVRFSPVGEHGSQLCKPPSCLENRSGNSEQRGI